MSIGAYMPLGSTNAPHTKDGWPAGQPRGALQFASWVDCGEQYAAMLASKGYQSSVFWCVDGRNPPYDENGMGGGLCFDSLFYVREPECKWMTDTRAFVRGFRKVTDMQRSCWLYCGNTYHTFAGYKPLDECTKREVESRADRMGRLCVDAGFTGVAIDASANARIDSAAWLIAQRLLRLGLLVGYEGWADDMRPHWKADVRLHGFSKPQWWREDWMSNGTKYGSRPLGGRSVLHLEGATKVERVALAHRILKTGCSVYDDVWNGVTPADMEAK